MTAIRAILLLAVLPGAALAQWDWTQGVLPSDPVVQVYEAKSLTLIGKAVINPDAKALGETAVTIQGAGSGMKLAFGRLPAGIYALYVCAKPTDVKNIGSADQLKPLYLELSIDSGADSIAQHHRVRAPVSQSGQYEYVTRIYFHTPQERDYSGELTLGKRSAITQLTIDRLELRNPISDFAIEPTKTSRVTWTDDDINKLRKQAALQGTLAMPLRKRPLTDPQRQLRDDVVWHQSVPPLNVCSADVPATAEPHNKELARLYEEAQLRLGQPLGQWQLSAKAYDQPWVLIHNGLNLSYTLDDLRAGETLPKPWPFTEDGGGTYYPKAGFNDAIIARHITARFDAMLEAINDLSYRYLLLGDLEAAADGAFLLSAIAYHYPGYDWSVHGFNNIISAQRAFAWQGQSGRLGAAKAISSKQVADLLRAYDALFPYIEENGALAKRVGRFVPWVLSWQDVVRLLDTFLVKRAEQDVQEGRLYKTLPAAKTIGKDLKIPTMPSAAARLARDGRNIVTLNMVGMDLINQAKIKASLNTTEHAAVIESVDYNSGIITLNTPLPDKLLDDAIAAFATPSGPWLSHIKPIDSTHFQLTRSTKLFDVTIAQIHDDMRNAVLVAVDADDLVAGVRVCDDKGQLLGRGSISIGDRYFYTGYPQARRHLAKISEADLADAQGRMSVIVNGYQSLQVNQIRDDGYMLFTAQPPSPLPTGMGHPGNPGVTLQNETKTRQWRAMVTGNRYNLTLDQGRFLKNEPQLVILHTLGPGDKLTTPGRLHMQRIASTGHGIYEVTANTGFTLELSGRRAFLSHDEGKTWQRIKGKTSWGTLTFSVSETDLLVPGVQRVLLKIE